MKSKGRTRESPIYKIICGQAGEKYLFTNQQPPPEDRPIFDISQKKRDHLNVQIVIYYLWRSKTNQNLMVLFNVQIVIFNYVNYFYYNNNKKV